MTDNSISFEEALAQRQKWSQGAKAEELGFAAAKWESTCRRISRDAYLQERYEQGFSDGRTLIALATGESYTMRKEEEP